MRSILIWAICTTSSIKQFVLKLVTVPCKFFWNYSYPTDYSSSDLLYVYICKLSPSIIRAAAQDVIQKGPVPNSDDCWPRRASRIRQAKRKEGGRMTAGEGGGSVVVVVWRRGAGASCLGGPAPRPPLRASFSLAPTVLERAYPET